MRTSVRAPRWAALAVGLTLLAGCNDGPKVVSVSGTITRNGKPVPSMTIHFVPTVGRPSWGLSDANGRYTLEYDNQQKGALVGQHTVWVQWRPTSPQEELNPKKANKPAELPAIQEKYGVQEKSPLKIEITRSVDDLEIKLD